MDRTIAVVGAGLIGRAWSMVFARAGWRVRLNDRDPRATRRGAGVHRSEPRRAGGIRARRRSGRCAGAHRLRAGARGRGGRGRLGAGKPAGNAGGEARGLRGARSACAACRGARELDVGDPRIAIHRRPCRGARVASSPIPSIRRTSCRSSSCAARRGPRRTRHRARAGGLRGSGAGADRRAPRDRRLHPQPAAGRAAGGGDAARRRGLCVAGRSGQDGARRSRSALVVHGTAGDDRAQRARRRRRLLRALRRLLPAGSPPSRRTPPYGMRRTPPESPRRWAPAPTPRSSMRARAGATAG